jgi:ATP-dependent DNA helicase 2 subunit 2
LQDAYNPFINRINQVVQHRLIHPNQQIPEPYEVLTKFMNPPADLVKIAHSKLEDVIKAADVKKGGAYTLTISQLYDYMCADHVKF